MASCRKIAALMGAYVYGDLSPGEMKAVRLHAAACEACAGEIAARSRVVSLIPSDVPEMTDEERQQVSWAVRGAVRSEAQTRPFSSRVPTFAGVLAVAVLIGAAFAGGVAYQKAFGPVKTVTQTIVKEVPVSVPETARYSESPSAEPSPIATLPDSVIDPFMRSQRPVYRWMQDPRAAPLASDAVATPSVPQSWPWDDGLGFAPPLIIEEQPATSGGEASGTQAPAPAP